MRGRKPDPSPTRQPTSAADMPVAPEWLSESARVEWDRISEILSSSGLLARADADVLSAYVETLVEYRLALAHVSEHGLTFDHDGMLKRNPAVGIAADARKDLLRLAGELGMTPIARQRLKIEAQKRDELQDFIDSGMKIAQ